MITPSPLKLFAEVANETTKTLQLEGQKAIEGLKDGTAEATEEAIKQTELTKDVVVQKVAEASEAVSEEVKRTIFERFNFGGNALGEWLIALGVFVGVFLLLKGLIALTLIRVRKTNLIKEEGVFKRLVVASLATISPIALVFLALDAATLPLELPKNIQAFADSLPLFALLWQMAVWTRPVIAIAIGHYVNSRETDQDRMALKTLMGPMKFILLTLSWSILALVGLDNAGINVTALVASLGIGGIAIGLALQGVLGDLFASLSLALDKPFVIGEFIITNDFIGTVKHIGLKSTRLESLGGEQIIIPNSDLTSARIRNYTRMERRRIVQRFGVIYNTPAEQLEAIPSFVTHIIDSIDGITLDRINFSGFGDSSLDFELVYYVESPDFNIHMNKQEEYLIKLFKKFKEEALEFAFPSRTLFIEKGGVTDLTLEALTPSD